MVFPSTNLHFTLSVEVPTKVLEPGCPNLWSFTLVPFHPFGAFLAFDTGYVWWEWLRRVSPAVMGYDVMVVDSALRAPACQSSTRVLGPLGPQLPPFRLSKPGHLHSLQCTAEGDLWETVPHGHNYLLDPCDLVGVDRAHWALSFRMCHQPRCHCGLHHRSMIHQ